MAKRESTERMSLQDYESALLPLELELNRVARWVQAKQRRVLIIFEGRDTAGKGGVISTKIYGRSHLSFLQCLNNFSLDKYKNV